MEVWDLYDKDRNKLGKTITRKEFFDRGMRMEPGEYHMSVIIVAVSSRGEILCTLRSPDKPNCPNMWENPGGAVLSGETSLEGAVRELWEETGIRVRPEQLTLAYRQTRRDDSHFDIFFTSLDLPAEEVVLQEGETVDARWIPYEAWEALGRAGEILTPAGADCDEFFETLRAYVKEVSTGRKTSGGEEKGPTVSMISLGCAKNQVDGEMLLAALEKAGFVPVEDPEGADIAIVNTCGFIDSAKKESIGAILDLAALKQQHLLKKLVVTGCLAERYREEVRRELPEVDAVLGIGANGDVAGHLKRMLEQGAVEAFPEKGNMPLCGDRKLSTPPWTAYLKIAEGCDNRCSYCAIPLIRGGYRSRTMESIEEEARGLAAGGVKELVLIAQDTTRYGLDLYGRYALAELLRRLCGIPALRWIRVLYCYPDSVTDELLDVMRTEEKVVSYIDLPLQHASGNILKAMNRRGDRQSLTGLMEKIREKMPDVVLRTTLITGFPGETEEDFSELAEFVKEVRFDKLGCFAYSREEDTPAAELPGQIEEEVKERRAEILLDMQARIMEQKGAERVGSTLEVLVEGFDEESGCWYGRSRLDAPDVDGVFYLQSEEELVPGEFVYAVVEESADCDLFGRVTEPAGGQQR